MNTPQIVDVPVQSPVIQQDKDATRTYSFDLSDLLDPGDTLAACAWSSSPTGLSVSGSGVTNGSAVLQASISGGAVGVWYAVRASWVSELGQQDDFVVRVYVEPDQEDVSSLGTALFPSRFSAVAALRRDRLLLAASSLGSPGEVSDDYLWSKLLAAESQVAHTLRVPLQVTQFFPDDPSDADIAALPMGMPWDVDPGYDYDPAFFQSDSWGFIPLRKRPLQSVQQVQIHFPAAGATTFYTIPDDWIRADKKAGQVQFIPNSGSGGIPLNAFMLQAMGMGRRVPFSIRVTYRAGLANAAKDFPELLDAVQKKAVLKTIEDRFLPQSGSISSDGLSESMSVDMEKYRDSIDAILNGAKGANGGLMALLHGIRLGVL